MPVMVTEDIILGFESKREIERERKVWKREVERGMSVGLGTIIDASPRGLDLFKNSQNSEWRENWFLGLEKAR